MVEVEAVLFVGRRQADEEIQIPPKVTEEFSAPVQWKNFPDDGQLLARLINTSYCVIDLDTLTRRDKSLALDISKDRPFWIYSRRSNTMLMLDGVNGLMILNPPPGQ